ncbi:hypothetical protein JL721_3530 [Aureococcus anophagefferens]|nr:hypothetical protein JL721_3530 [Aureococcus anophagefferens]
MITPKHSALDVLERGGDVDAARGATRTGPDLARDKARPDAVAGLQAALRTATLRYLGGDASAEAELRALDAALDARGDAGDAARRAVLRAVAATLFDGRGEPRAGLAEAEGLAIILPINAFPRVAQNRAAAPLDELLPRRPFSPNAAGAVAAREPPAPTALAASPPRRKRVSQPPLKGLKDPIERMADIITDRENPWDPHEAPRPKDPGGGEAWLDATDVRRAGRRPDVAAPSITTIPGADVAWASPEPSLEEALKPRPRRPSLYGLDVAPVDDEPSELLMEPSELLMEPSELLVEPSELLVEPSELLVEPSELLVEPSELLVEPSLAERAEPSLAAPSSLEPSVVEDPGPAALEPRLSPEPFDLEPPLDFGRSLLEPSASLLEPSASLLEPSASLLEPSASLLEPSAFEPSLVEPSEDKAGASSEPSLERSTLDAPSEQRISPFPEPSLERSTLDAPSEQRISPFPEPSLERSTLDAPSEHRISPFPEPSLERPFPEPSLERSTLEEPSEHRISPFPEPSLEKSTLEEPSEQRISPFPEPSLEPSALDEQIRAKHRCRWSTRGGARSEPSLDRTAPGEPRGSLPEPASSSSSDEAAAASARAHADVRRGLARHVRSAPEVDPTRGYQTVVVDQFPQPARPRRSAAPSRPCAFCTKPGGLRCVRCDRPYCSHRCQIDDWRYGLRPWDVRMIVGHHGNVWLLNDGRYVPKRHEGECYERCDAPRNHKENDFDDAAPPQPELATGSGVARQRSKLAAILEDDEGLRDKGGFLAAVTSPERRPSGGVFDENPRHDIQLAFARRSLLRESAAVDRAKMKRRLRRRKFKSARGEARGPKRAKQWLEGLKKGAATRDDVVAADYAVAEAALRETGEFQRLLGLRRKRSPEPYEVSVRDRLEVKLGAVAGDVAAKRVLQAKADRRDERLRTLAAREEARDRREADRRAAFEARYVSPAKRVAAAIGFLARPLARALRRKPRAPYEIAEGRVHARKPQRKTVRFAKDAAEPPAADAERRDRDDYGRPRPSRARRRSKQVRPARRRRPSRSPPREPAAQGARRAGRTRRAASAAAPQAPAAPGEPAAPRPEEAPRPAARGDSVSPQSSVSSRDDSHSSSASLRAKRRAETSPTPAPKQRKPDPAYLRPDRGPSPRPRRRAPTAARGDRAPAASPPPLADFIVQTFPMDALIEKVSRIATVTSIVTAKPGGAHAATFRRIFDDAKERELPVLVRGRLPFNASKKTKKKATAAEALGVPEYDAIVYLSSSTGADANAIIYRSSSTGVVAIDGAGASALAARLHEVDGAEAPSAPAARLDGTAAFAATVGQARISLKAALVGAAVTLLVPTLILFAAFYYAL